MRTASALVVLLFSGLLASSCTSLREPGVEDLAGSMRGLPGEEELKLARALLREASELTGSKVGFAAKTSECSWAFSVLYLGSSDPAAEFQALLQNAEDPSGKVYALVGLHSVDKKAYRKHKKDLSATLEIPTMFGCLALPRKYGDLRKAIESGALIEQILLRRIPYRLKEHEDGS